MNIEALGDGLNSIILAMNNNDSWQIGYEMEKFSENYMAGQEWQ